MDIGGNVGGIGGGVGMGEGEGVFRAMPMYCSGIGGGIQRDDEGRGGGGVREGV